MGEFRARRFFTVGIVGLLLVLGEQGTRSFANPLVASGPAQGRSGKGEVQSAPASSGASESQPPGAAGRVAVPRGYKVDLETLQSLKAHAPFFAGPQPVQVDDPRVLIETPQPSAPNLPTSFQGITQTSWIPPDNGTAAGPNHLVEMVNASWRAFSKTGTAATALIPFCGSGGWWSTVLPAGVTLCGDPKILYDQFSNRWVMIAMALGNSANQAWYLLATSWTSDPTGTWCVSSLNATLNGSTPTSNVPDDPRLGLDNQALYITSNQYDFFTRKFQYAKLRIVGKTQLYNNTCSGVSWLDVWGLTNTDGSAAFAVQPASTLGTPGVEYLINADPVNGNSVTLWSLTNPLSASPTLTRTTVPVATYSLPPNASQCGGATAIDTEDARLLNAVYRNGSLWTTQTIAWGSVSRARYLRIDPTGPTVLDDFAFGAIGLSYYYPAIMIDSADNVYTVFNRSSASECVGIRYSGRLSTDPAGTLQGSVQLHAGMASYNVQDSAGRNRWGDYSGIAPDPAEPGKVWIAGEYASAPNTWATWIGQLALSGVTFSGWAALPGGGTTPAGPAVVIFNGAPWVFVRGMDNRIYQNRLMAGGWSGWSEVPGGGFTSSSPGTTVFNNTLYLFVRGTDNRIYQNLLTTSGWSGWNGVPGGGVTLAGPAAVVFQNFVYLAVQGTDNRIYDNLLTSVGWTGWAAVPGDILTPSGPAATVFNGELWYVVQGMDDHVYRNLLPALAASDWTGWVEVPGGSFTPSGPGAAATASTLYLVVRGEDNRIYLNLGQQ